MQPLLLSVFFFGLVWFVILNDFPEMTDLFSEIHSDQIHSLINPHILGSCGRKEGRDVGLEYET
ncbi:MAG: hypothetical protein AB7V56_07030 [Candidatus Nitrosocosmicus sp.]